jgi:hypothetical protein
MLIDAELVKAFHAFCGTQASNVIFTGTLSLQDRGPVFYGEGLFASQ